MVRAAFAMGMRFADVAVSMPALRQPRGGFMDHLRQIAGYVSAMPLGPPLSIVAAQSPAGPYSPRQSGGQAPEELRGAGDEGREEGRTHW